MASVTHDFQPNFSGQIPAKGTLPMATNIRIPGGTIATVDADGRADVPTAGQNAAGVALATFDNRTTAPEGGGAGAINCELLFGVFEFDYTGTAPDAGEVLYVSDNHTVTTNSAGGTLGIAGYCVEQLRSGKCSVWIGPHVVGQIVIASTEASQLDDLQAEVGDYTGGGGAEADVATGLVAAEVDIAALQTDATSAADETVVSLGSLRLSTGAAIAAFADNTTDGFELSGSECLGIRWNDSGSSRIVVAGEVHVPSDWDDTAAVVLHAEGFRVGAADAAMVGTVTAFAQEVGDAYTADADAGGSTTAFDGATTVITDETLEFAAGVLPAGSKVSFTFTPDAALDGDDFVLTGLKFVGTRALRAA